MVSNSDALEYEAVRFARRFLGVPARATPREIRAAFARRAKVVHPDRFDPVAQKEEWAEANVILRELNEAYRLSLAVAERQGKTDFNSAVPNPAPSNSTAAPTPSPGASYRRRTSREPECSRAPIGFFDLGIFLVAGVFQFLGGNAGMLVFLAIFCGIDFWMRWCAGKRTHSMQRHLLLPRMGLSFICMPMWIATLMVGVFGWIFPWNELGHAKEQVGTFTFIVLALIAATFWFADYSYETTRPD